MPKVRTFVLAGAAGALAAYFLDPEMGRTRRARARDMLMGRIRRGADRMEHLRRRVASDAEGMVRRVTHEVPDDTLHPTDETLAHKVESEALGYSGIPSGRVNVNAERGVVVLRGQVDTPDDVRRVEKLVREVDGVREVENLLHTPGTPAPNRSE
jgi:BON domain